VCSVSGLLLVSVGTSALTNRAGLRCFVVGRWVRVGRWGKAGTGPLKDEVIQCCRLLLCMALGTVPRGFSDPFIHSFRVDPRGKAITPWSICVVDTKPAGKTGLQPLKAVVVDVVSAWYCTRVPLRHCDVRRFALTYLIALFSCRLWCIRRVLHTERRNNVSGLWLSFDETSIVGSKTRIHVGHFGRN